MTGERGRDHYPILEYFRWEHLPEPARAISHRCAMVAEGMADELPTHPETAAGLRKLLEAKDCFVRASLVRRRSPDAERS